METVRRAVIDVGTNSVKLLVADVNGHLVKPLHEESKQTRLGKNFYETHRLQPDAIQKTAEATAEFTKTAREKQASSIRIIATSAARDAVNPDDLTSAIETVCGLKVDIISGEKEADLAFRGAATDGDWMRKPVLLLDVGGGSTEFILGHGGRQHFAQSFPLGTVRLMEKFPHSDPPTDAEFKSCRNWVCNLIKNEVRPKLEPAMRTEIELSPEHGDVCLVGTGGTTSILARMENKLDRFDRDRIEKTVLTFDAVRAYREKLWSLPLAQRKEIPGIPKLRADVILTGLLIYEMIMQEFGFKELRVSTRGLRFAAVMEQ